MNSSINRIITFFAFTAIFQLQLSAQTFDLGTQPLIPHPSSLIPNPPPLIPHPSSPSCGFDEINEQLGQQDPHHLLELQHIVNDVLPMLSANNGPESMVAEPLLTIPVVVHVIHSGEPEGQGENMSEAQIRAQLAVLNLDFAAINAQFFNTPAVWAQSAGIPNIQFCLATVDPSGNPTNGITRHDLEVTGPAWNNNNINSSIKPQTKWDPLRYMNIYVLPIPGTTSAGGVVGFANYPTTALIGADQDGIVIDYRWFGAPGFPTSGYRSLTHETGHYLGLFHTFNGTSCNSDDGIADTPNIDNSTRSYNIDLDCEDFYPAAPISCGNAHLYVNYMDYVTENCYTSFTNGQVNVMRAVLNGTAQAFGSRELLLDNAPLQCVIPANDAGIVRLVSPKTTACTPDSLTPVVTLRNFGTTDLASATIRYRINGGPLKTFNWMGDLFPGENEDVALPSFLSPSGNYYLTAFTQSPNGMADERLSNDTLVELRFTYLATPPPMKEDFENETSFPVSTGIFELNIGSDSHKWALTNDASAFGQGSTSAVFNNFPNDPPGTLDAMITRHFDLSEVEGAQIKFDVAYAPHTSRNDTLFVIVATNCSPTFNISQHIFKKGGAQLSTAPANNQLFTPSPTQWRTETVDLSGYDGFSDVTVAFLNVSGHGNRLFVDNIQIGIACNALALQMTTIPNDCNTAGICTGSATVNVTASNGGLQYQWAGQPSNYNLPTVVNQCPGTASVTITDAFGCTATASAQIPQAPSPQAQISTSQTTSYTANDGTITLTFTAGIPPFDVFWNNGGMMGQALNITANPYTITGLAKGDYAIQIVDDHDCSTTVTAAVASVCDVFSISTPVTNVACFGGSNGSVTALPLNGMAPYMVQWSNSVTTSTNPGLPAGNYTVTITDGNGCPATKTATIMQASQLQLNATATHETAFNAQNGTAMAVASGGSPSYQYLWNTGANSFFISNLAPGTFTVTITDLAGCTATATTNVNSFSCANFQPQIFGTNVTCHGSNNGSASVSIAGGTMPYNYMWEQGAQTAAISNLAPDIYNVTVSDATNCSAVLSVEITEPALLQATAIGSPETVANGNNGSASVTASGGTQLITGGYLILWNNGQNTQSINGLAPGNYSVVVTDANGCTATSSAVVEAELCGLLISIANTPTSCETLPDGTATVAGINGGTGPFQYLWSNGAQTSTILNLLANTYMVTVTDANNCTASATTNVISDDNVLPVLDLTGLSIFMNQNGEAHLTINDVDNGSFDNCSLTGLTLSQETFDCQQLGPQTVAVTATDASGNTLTENVTVTVVDTMVPTIVCPQSLVVTMCNNVVYNLPVATDNCGTPTLSLVAGIASGGHFPIGTTEVVWQASDVSGNVATCTFTVSAISNIVFSFLIEEPSCHGMSDGAIILSLSGGLPPYAMAWSHGGPPTNLPAGTYMVTVTDASGCELGNTVEMGEPAPLDVLINGITSATNGQANGIIEYVVNGGTEPYALTWLKGGIPQPGFDPLHAPPGSYQLKVTDSNGCIFTSPIIVVGNVVGLQEPTWARGLLLFPNPTDGLVFLKMDVATQGLIKATAFDVNGRTLFFSEQEMTGAATLSLDFQSVVAGVYWLKVEMGGEVVWRRVVVL